MQTRERETTKRLSRAGILASPMAGPIVECNVTYTMGCKCPVRLTPCPQTAPLSYKNDVFRGARAQGNYLNIYPNRQQPRRFTVALPQGLKALGPRADSEHGRTLTQGCKSGRPTDNPNTPGVLHSPGPMITLHAGRFVPCRFLGRTSERRLAPGLLADLALPADRLPTRQPGRFCLASFPSGRHRRASALPCLFFANNRGKRIVPHSMNKEIRNVVYTNNDATLDY